MKGPIAHQNKETPAYAESPDLDVLETHERDVLVEIAAGLGNKEIAVRLGLSIRKVQAHRERLMRKLQIRGIANLTCFALSQGLATL